MPQRSYRTESSFKKALKKATESGALVHWYGTDHGWVIVTKKMVRRNPGGMRYTVTSSSGTVTPHRTKAAATKEYFRRYHKGDTWIQLSDRETGKVLRESRAKIMSPAKRGSYTFSGGEYKRNNPGTRYRGVVTAYPGHLLRGGKKQVKSSWFNSKKEAADWNYAMEQPGSSHHIERGAPYESAVGHYYFDKSRVAHGPFKTKKERAAHKRSTNPGGPLDTHAARELELFIENDADLYRQQYTPINKNLVTKMARGIYNHAGAVKLFGYLMESGAKKYIREHGSPGDQWHQMFSPATRKAAAERFADHFEVEAKLGNYDSLLPKKYSDWRLRSNPGRLTDVLVKQGGRTFKAKAKYDAKVGRVRIFANPRVARAINPEQKWTISAIRAANKSAGYHFFDRGALRFFNSKVFPTVYQGPGGIYFVTSETMQPEIPSLKRYTVRKFLPESSNVHSAEQFRDLTSAKVSARMASRG